MTAEQQPQRPEWPASFQRLIDVAQELLPYLEAMPGRLPAASPLRAALAPFQREHKKEAPE